eukprot:4776050-Pyramimonas_sp.AAC.1
MDSNGCLSRSPFPYHSTSASALCASVRGAPRRSGPSSAGLSPDYSENLFTDGLKGTQIGAPDTVTGLNLEDD